MAVKLRLTRVGKTKQPQYRIVAADSRSPRDGRFIEIVGHYNPRSEPSTISVDNDKAVKWLSQGAQPTERVKKLLEISGALEQFAGVEDRRRPRARVLSVSDDTGADVAADDGAEPTSRRPDRGRRAQPHRHVDRRRPRRGPRRQQPPTVAACVSTSASAPATSGA